MLQAVFSRSSELLGKDQYGHSSIFGYEVNIHSSPSASRQELFSTASNKVTVATLTSHNFDANDAGANQMVACNDKYVAYVLEGGSVCVCVCLCVWWGCVCFSNVLVYTCRYEFHSILCTWLTVPHVK